MDKKGIAVQYKHSGYNCAQAVIAAYADELGIDLETARALGAGAQWAQPAERYAARR